MSRRLIRQDGAALVVSSDADLHLAAHPEVTDELLLEAFEAFELSNYNSELRDDVDLGRQLGPTSKVATPPIRWDEKSLFAIRKNRNYPSRIVVGVEKPLSSVMTLIAERKGGTFFVLRTAYVGELAPPEPFSFNTILKMKLKPDAVVDYWCRHALIYDPVECETEPFLSTWQEVLMRAVADREERRALRQAAEREVSKPGQ